MRQSGSEKLETIRLVEDSELSITATVRELGVPRSTFYDWYRRYKERGAAGLLERHSGPGFCWSRIPDPVREQVVETALEHPEVSPKELAWQTDFTYFRVVGWGWYYLSTVLDDYSRYIIAWKLFQAMATSDVQDTLDLALEATGVIQVQVRHPAPAVERQWSLLRVARAQRLLAASRHQAHSRCALPSDDPGKDRTLSPLDEERGQRRTWSNSSTTIIRGIWKRPSVGSSSTTTTAGTTNP